MGPMGRRAPRPPAPRRSPSHLRPRKKPRPRGGITGKQLGAIAKARKGEGAKTETHFSRRSVLRIFALPRFRDKSFHISVSLMKAIQLEKPQSFHAIDIAEPLPPGPGEALLRIHRIGICGTDYAGFLGKMPFYSYPRIPGHELGVEVLSVGEGVTNVRPGDRCSVEPYLNCQRCYACRRGLTNCCESNQTLGVMCDGGMCERMILPARKLHVSKKLSMEQLALVETLGIGCHAVDRGGVKAGDNVLIIG